MNKEQELRLHGPFKTDDFASYIYGSNDKIGGDNPVLEIRGWGYLTGNGHGALGLSHAEAVAEQKRFASFVVDALNAASPPAVAAGGVTEERVEAAAKAIFDTWSAQTSYWPPMTWEDAQRAAAHPADFPKMARIVPLCRAEARAALLAALAEREGWQPIETAPPAMHVTACRFDHDAGEWVYAVVMSPPIYPFTHWRMLDPPPSRGEGV